MKGGKEHGIPIVISWIKPGGVAGIEGAMFDLGVGLTTVVAQSPDESLARLPDEFYD